MQLEFKKSSLSGMHYPLTDIQADFEIDWPFRYQVTAKRNYLHRRTSDGQTDGTTDGRTDVAYDNNKNFFSKKKILKTALTKLKIAYNSLRQFMGLPCHNSDIEMFVNLNIKSFGELLRVFVLRFRSRIIISRNFMLSSICNSSCSIYSKLWAW